MTSSYFQSEQQATAAVGQRPVIWVLLGAKAGDNAQALSLARRIDCSIHVKQLAYNSLHHVPNVLLGQGLASVELSARAQLGAPWPDIVIGVGKRSAPVALWIKRTSGGRTKVVQIGRPRAPLSHFDLVITTPQYGLPQCDNVIEIDMPFAEPAPVDNPVVAKWKQQWSHLPRPWLVAAFGGSKHPQVLGERELSDFGVAVNILARKLGSSVLLFSSPRSATGALEIVRAGLKVSSWTPGISVDVRGSYSSALSLGDQFAVTSDSVSMVSEMYGTGKPCHVFQLPLSAVRVNWSSGRGLTRILAERGLLQAPRNTAKFIQNLVSTGLVVDLKRGAADFVAKSGADTHREAVMRVKALVAN